MEMDWGLPSQVLDGFYPDEDLASLPTNTTQLGSLSFDRLFSTGAGMPPGIIADDTSVPANVESMKLEYDDLDALMAGHHVGISPTALSADSAQMFEGEADDNDNSSEAEPTPTPTPSKRTRRPLGAPRRPLGAPRRASVTSVDSASKRVKMEEEVVSQPPARDVSPSPSPEAGKETHIKEKNRDAARLFRQRRKDYLRNLEDELRKSQQKRAEQETRMRELESSNAALRATAQDALKRADEKELELLAFKQSNSSSPPPAEAADVTSAGSITIPPMSQLKESLDMKQLGQVVVCLMIIAGIVGPIAGWDVPAITAAMPATAEGPIVKTAEDEPEKGKEEEAHEEICPVPTAHSPTPSCATSQPTDLAVVPSRDASAAPASMADLQNVTTHISTYLSAIDPAVIAYLVLAANTVASRVAPPALTA